MNTQTKVIKKEGNVVYVDFGKPIDVRSCDTCFIRESSYLPQVKLYQLTNNTLICGDCLEIGADLNKLP